MNRKQYNSDARYAKVLEKMDLLGIMDITTTRQHKNGTIVWKLPIKMEWPKNKDNKSYKCIEVASFSTGYVRNQNSGYSNYQLNKRCMNEPEYFKDYEYNDNYTKKKWTGKYRMFQTRGCKLIPIEIDRLEYLLKYCVKNYYIKNANQIPNGDFVAKWKYDEAIDLGRTNAEAECLSDCDDLTRTVIKLEEKLVDMTEARDYYQQKIHQAHDKHNKAYNDGYAAAEVDCKGMIDNLSVTVNGERYKII